MGKGGKTERGVVGSVRPHFGRTNSLLGDTKHIGVKNREEDEQLAKNWQANVQTCPRFQETLSIDG